MFGRYHRAIESVLVEPGAPDLHVQSGAGKPALRNRHRLLASDDPLRLAVEIDRPKLAAGLFGMSARVEHGVTNPERKRSARVIRALEIAFVKAVVVIGTKAGRVPEIAIGRHGHIMRRFVREQKVASWPAPGSPAASA